MLRSLSDAEWTRVNELLDQALDLDPEVRTAFLEEACDDPAIRKHVDVLLNADASAPTFLDGEAMSFAAPAFTALDSNDGPDDGMDNGTDETDLGGRRIGPYRLVEPAGSGGMARVYRAERVDGAFDHQVAVKLLPLGLDSPAARERFRVERQVLATLEHPNIARLLDGGVTEDDVPYLVLEYVNGTPITEHCETHHLDLDARLDLLQQIGDVLQFAHRNLVVHRDVKPANVLVTDEGRVKLLDFGIAKILDAESVAHTVPATRTGTRPMTPAYAAPEQIRGDTITAATDVYQFGILAYEVLTGHRPFADCQHVFDVEQAVLHRTPPAPSEAVLEPSGAASESSNRTAVRRHRDLKGDLDTVVLKALRKEPDARYPSVEAMTADLRRVTDGQPVSARPATLGYRSKKFIQRNRTAVGVAALMIALLAGLTSYYVIRIQAERDRAEATVTFLKDLISISDPETGDGGAVPARVLLQKGAARLDTSFSTQPVLRAELKDIVGQAFRGYGLYERALDLHRDALDLRIQAHGLRSLPVADARNDLGEVYYYLDRPDAAEAQYRRSLTVRRAILGQRHVDVAQSLNNLALIDAMRGRYGDGAEKMAEALSIFRENLPPDHWRVANALNNLAVLRGQQGALNEAEQRYREALAMHRRVKGPAHRDVARTQASLGSLVLRQQRYAEADSILQDALRLAQAATTDQLPLQAYIHSEIGEVRTAQKDYDTAERHFQIARTQYRDALPPNHRRQAHPLLGLAEALRAQGQTDEALLYAREALQIRTGALDPGHPDTEVTRALVGALLADQGRTAEAERHLTASRAALDTLSSPPAREARATVCSHLNALAAQTGDADMRCETERDG